MRFPELLCGVYAQHASEDEAVVRGDGGNS